MFDTIARHPDDDPDPFETLVEVLIAATRHDLVLTIIPMAFAVAVVVMNASALVLTQTLIVAAVVGILVIATPAT